MPETSNRDTRLAWTYHDATKHSAQSIRATPHFLDFANQPMPFKIYPDLPTIPIGRGTELGRILYFSAGITKKKTWPGGEIYFRAASCTGALYEIELYLVRADGVYHFNPGDFSLRQLRSGDYRGVLARATANEKNVVHAPMTIVCTATYWRNAWKYRARTYRHFGWDNGTILANMLAMTGAIGLPAKILSGFLDSEVNRLLDLDTKHEVAFSMVPIGADPASAPEPPREIPKLDLPTVRLSDHEVEYPELRSIHDASCLQSSDEVGQWRAAMPEYATERIGDVLSKSPEDVILRRGSTRRFARIPITLDQLSRTLQYATRPLSTDFAGPLNDLYLIVNAVDGLEPGAYFYHRDNGSLELLKSGNFRSQARYLGLEQDLPGDAAADIFLVADLHAILDRLGNRGYRAVQLEAGIIGGRLYLGAYAQQFGATGLTFFDDDVTDFFSPHAKSKSAIFLVALGKSQKISAI
jgi:SagB-type dehydrogenase family enzyme